MNAGKSTHLLQVAHNYEEGGSKVLLFSSKIDDRYGEGKITSRLGLQRNCFLYENSSNFEEIINKACIEENIKRQDLSCILVDEAQFLSKAQVQQLHKIAALGTVPVMCFGLRSDFRGEAFEGSAALLTLSDDIEELKTICACGKKATMNARLNDKGEFATSGEQVVIGGNSTYKQLCSKCYYTKVKFF